jgi:hypothetical protein
LSPLVTPPLILDLSLASSPPIPSETIPSPLTLGLCGGGSKVDPDVVSDERERVDVGVEESKSEYEMKESRFLAGDGG